GHVADAMWAEFGAAYAAHGGSANRPGPGKDGRRAGSLVLLAAAGCCGLVVGFRWGTSDLGWPPGVWWALAAVGAAALLGAGTYQVRKSRRDRVADGRPRPVGTAPAGLQEQPGLSGDPGPL